MGVNEKDWTVYLVLVVRHLWTDYFAFRLLFYCSDSTATQKR
jgi:hypothetical protein